MTKIYILAGQSNMEGLGITAELPAFLPRELEGVKFFVENQFRPINYAKNFGPEIGFVKKLRENDPDQSILLCKVALGGANLYYDWNPDGISKGPQDIYRGPLFPALIHSINDIISFLNNENEEYIIAGMLWMQGERDAVFDFMAQAYKKNMMNFIGAIRKKLSVQNLPFIIGQICPRLIDPITGNYKHAYRKIVQAAQSETAEIMHNVYLIPTYDLTQCDNLHFDTVSMIELGQRYAKKIIEIS